MNLIYIPKHLGIGPVVTYVRKYKLHCSYVRERVVEGGGGGEGDTNTSCSEYKQIPKGMTLERK